MGDKSPKNTNKARKQKAGKKSDGARQATPAVDQKAKSS